jgi:crotonobetainyl-CoA:carnitine CoA-transferase CaiB-like acyl-CoA transferase
VFPQVRSILDIGGQDCKAIRCDGNGKVLTCRAIGSPAWTKDRLFDTFDGRKRNEYELDKQIESWTVEHNAEEVMFMMQEAGIEGGAVRNFGDIAENCPQTKNRGYLTHLEHPVIGETMLAGNSYLLSKTPGGFAQG